MTSDQDRIEYLSEMVAQGAVLMKVETDQTGDPARYRIGWKGLGEDSHKEYVASAFRDALDATIRDDGPLPFDEQRLEMYDGGDPPSEEVEAIIACLGDDAAQLRQENPEDERAANMSEAAEMLARLVKANAQLHEQGCKLYARLTSGVSVPDHQTFGEGTPLPSTPLEGEKR